MHKWKHGKLHSGAKKGKKVKSRKQAVAIMLSEKRNESKHGGTYKSKGDKSVKKKPKMIKGQKGGKGAAADKKATKGGFPNFQKGSGFPAKAKGKKHAGHKSKKAR